MKLKSDRPQAEKPAVPARTRRFRIDKLEERIAPKKGGKGTNNCPTLDCWSGTCY